MDNWQFTIILRGRHTPEAPLRFTEGFTNEFVALVHKWRMRISSHQMLAGQIAPIIQPVMLQATPEHRRSKSFASKPKQI